MILSNDVLQLDFNKTTFGVERLFVEGDAERLNWVRGREFGLPSGNNFLSKSVYSERQFIGEFLFFNGLTCTLTVTAEKERVRFSYLFKNDGKKAVETAVGDLGVYLPFNDDFDKQELSLRRRVHAHFRTEGVPHVYCERYSGASPAMGLVFYRGESVGYSLERGAKRTSRGTILLDLPALRLAVGESYEFGFVIFLAKGREDFFQKAKEYGLYEVKNSGLVVFPDEEIRLVADGAIALKTDEGEIPFSDGTCTVVVKGEGEKRTTVRFEGKEIPLTYYVLSRDLLRKRAAFVTDKQYLSDGAYVGAFTAFDKEAMTQAVRGGVHSPLNLAGDRAAPLLFLLAEAQKDRLSQEILAKIDAAIAFYDREVLKGGQVSDDVGGKRASLCKTYDNYPLYAAIKYEEYRYSGKESHLTQGAVILLSLYNSEAPFAVTPVLLVEKALRKTGKDALADELKSAVLTAADSLLQGGVHPHIRGKRFDPHGLCGETSLLFDAYALSREERFLREGKARLAILDGFCFSSFDYRTDGVPKLFETDFGSGLTYDMSPHLSAARFAVVYDQAFCMTEEEIYRAKAKRILLATMTLFDAEGGAVRSKSACRALNDAPIASGEQISFGEDVVLYYFDLLFDRK